MENTNEKFADDLFEEVLHGDKNSFYELEKLAADGNAQAMNNLAKIYLKGFGIIESSYQKAVELFQKAASLNDAYALFRLGEFYRDAKYGLEQDGHIAAEYFIKASQYTNPKGVSKCLNLAAEIYHYGEGGVTPDAQKAIELYEKLAKMESRGEAEPRSTGDTALLKLAQIYTEGCGNLKPNAKKAIEYLKNAFYEWAFDDSDVHSYLVASYNLAEFYRDGKAGIKPDGYKVIEYLSELGHLETIAEIYRDGKYNVRANGYKAIKYFLKKSECGFGSLDTLDEFFLQNDSGEHADLDAGIYFFDTVEFCNVDVFEEIAQIYLEGKGGVRPDGYKALKYLSQAVNGINRIINFTKKFIENNSEIKQERPETLRRVFHRLSRTNRDISEQIAEIYSDGKAGVQPDGHKAIEYFLKALEAERDNPDEDSKDNISAICHKIARIYLEGCGNVQTDGYKAIEYFEKCSNFERIAEIYRDGKACVEPDPQKAIEYFLKHEARIRRPQNSDDKINEFTIFLDNEERALVFGNIAEIYSSLNDGQKALEYFLKADELGDSWAWTSDEVAKIYRYGKGKLKPDGVKLVEFLTKKFEQLESPANFILYEIAKVYEEGCGSLEPNMQKALEFYKKAAALGNDSAKEELAIRRLL